MVMCMHRYISGAFYRMGCAIEARPKLALTASCLCSLLCMLGLLWLNVVVDYETLWVPRTVESWDDKIVFERNFGEPDRLLVALITAAPGGDDNMLTLSKLQAAYRVHSMITGVDNYERLCTPAFDGGPCAVSSILAAWNFTEPSRDVAAMVRQDPIVDRRMRRPMVLSTLVGTSSSGDATALRMVFLMRSAPEFEKDVAAWEKQVIGVLHETWKVRSDDRLGEDHEDFPYGINVHIMAERSFQDENDRAINKDFMIVGLAVGVMVSYVTAVTGSNPPVRSRVLLGSSIVVCVGLSLGAGFGICGFLGIGFNQISQMCFFILFGIGVDDMFIILEKFKESSEQAKAQSTTAVLAKVASHNQPLEHTGEGASDAPRIAVALREAGPSITLTTVTDVAAFALGSNIEVPCISDFCKGTAACIFFVFVLQSTFFASLLVLDQRRMDAGRVDCCPCIVAAPKHLVAKETGGLNGVEGWTRRLIGQRFAPLLMQPVAKAVVLLVFSVVTLVAALRLGKLNNHMGITEWMPKDSYLLDFFDVLDTAFVGGSVTVHFVFDLRMASLSDPAVRAALSTTRDRVQALSLTLPPVNLFLDESSLCSDATSIVHCNDMDVKSWMESPDNAHWRPFIAVDGAGVVQYVRFTAELAQSAQWDIVSQVKMMEQARSAVEGCPLPAFAYSHNFLWWDRDKDMDQQVIQNVGLMLATAFVILVLFLPVALAVTVAALVTMVMLDLAGLVMTLWDVDLNVVSLLEIIMAVGFAVDYSAHIAHGFATADGTSSGNEQAMAALRALGPPVLQGGFSTMLAVSLIGFAKSKGFEVLFKMFAGLVGFGLLHGLVLLPVVLSLFPPCLRALENSEGGSRSSKSASLKDDASTTHGREEVAKEP